MIKDRLLTLLAYLLLSVSLQVAFAADFTSTPKSGSKGKWGWEESFAFTTFKKNIILYVQFAPEFQCDVAYFGILGNDEIDTITFKIDGHRFKSVQADTFVLKSGAAIAGFPLSKLAVGELKKGYFLRIDTDEGTLYTSLAGSALSFNMAYGNCMKKLETTTLKPSTAMKRNPISKPDNLPETTIPKLHTKILDGAPVTLFTGEFKEGDGQKIIREIKKNNSKLLVLISPGGRISEAQMTGYFLRSNNISTMSGSLCASACVFALSAGVQRFAIKDSKIGLHRTHFEGGGGSLEEGQRITGNYIRYFKSMGIDPEIVAIATQISSESIRWLTEDEMLDLKVITENITEDNSADSQEITVEGVVTNYLCGDNCYLTIKDNKGLEATGLCTAELCGKYNWKDAEMKKLQGKRAIVRLKKDTGIQYDGNGDPVSKMHEITKLIILN